MTPHFEELMEDWSDDDYSSSVQALVGSVFKVAAFDSARAYAEVKIDDEVHRLIHKTLAVKCKKSVSEDPHTLKNKLANALFKELQKTVGRGSYVIWRRRPYFIDDGEYLSMICRIGSAIWNEMFHIEVTI